MRKLTKVSFNSALALCSSPETCIRNSEYGLWRSGNLASSHRLLNLQYIFTRLGSPTVNFEFEKEKTSIQYALIQLFLQKFQTFGVVFALRGGLNFLPSSRGESLKSRLDPFQLFLGFREGSIGRGITITCQDELYSGISGGSNSCRVRDISQRTPTFLRHLYKG